MQKMNADSLPDHVKDSRETTPRSCTQTQRARLQRSLRFRIAGLTVRQHWVSESGSLVMSTFSNNMRNARLKTTKATIQSQVLFMWGHSWSQNLLTGISSVTHP